MVANNLLEVYSLIFSWGIYGNIWDLLVGSGLALIPFIAAVFSSFMDNYESGDAQSAIKGLELKIITMIVVMILCVMPFRSPDWEVDLGTVKYKLDVPDCAFRNRPEVEREGEGDDTRGNYNVSFDDMGGMRVYMPVAWGLVNYISSAITHSTIKTMGCVNNYELMLTRIGNVTIQDRNGVNLRERIRDFFELCYKPAVKRFEENPVPLPTNISEVESVDWLGSRILLNVLDDYYRHEKAFMEDMQRYGFQRMITRPSDEARENGAHPYCNEVWSGERAPGIAKGLRQLILEDIPEDKVGSILQDWREWGFNVMTEGPVDNDTKDDLLIKMILKAEAANLSSQTDIDMSNGFDTQQGFWRSMLDKFVSVATFFSSIDEYLQANSMKQMVKIAGPMILAMIQMVIIVAAPFVLVLGKYRITAFMSLALTYFAFEFINAIWAAAFWFDQRIMDIYHSAPESGLLENPTINILVLAISAISVILLPTVWLAIFGYAGSGMVRGMAIGGVGGGAASGAGAFSGGSARWARQKTVQGYRGAKAKIEQARASQNRQMRR